MYKTGNKINIEDYNYNLPVEKIAQYPVANRDESKLLLYINSKIGEDIFRNIHNYIPENSLLVFNNTKVIRARLIFRKSTGALIEILCIEPYSPGDYESSFSSTNPVVWKCIIGNLKKWKGGILSYTTSCLGRQVTINAERLKSEGETCLVNFSWNIKGMTFSEIIESLGHIPLPPYIAREDNEEDGIRYQTVYSSTEGSVAAPTAGLHFTDELLQNINRKGIKSVAITLHVGAGTFKPVKTGNIWHHEMHTEHFFVSYATLEKILESKGRIIAVGTTSIRAMESLYWLGVKIIHNPGLGPDELSVEQWLPYETGSEADMEESLRALQIYMIKNSMTELHALTKIMIIPGYKFMVINGMITNFHQPSSSLLLLISAWTGENWKELYNYALNNGFRFLSYGDSSLLLREKDRSILL